MAILGIDLGTTNSLIAYFDADKPALIPNALGHVLTPSVVGLADDGTILVGQAARDRLLTHPEKTVAAFKRFMGSSRETRLGKKTFRPEELSALVLRSLKADAEEFLKQPVSDVIISVPAYFNDHQRKATIDAGKLAGLNVRRIINEPTAAALAYGLADKGEGKFLIFDLGGGTFDVSIVDKFEGVLEVRATTGDTQLGGNDFTLMLERLIAEKHGVKHDKLKGQDAAQICRTADAIKIALTSEQNTGYVLHLESKPLQGAISRSDFDEVVEGLLRRLRAPVERAIQDASLAPSELDAVVLVGGATRMPMVRSLVARMFGRLPLMHLDPDTTIALGAAIQAALVERNSALDDTVMTDVCPHTLGIASLMEGEGPTLLVVPIIQRNAMVPISRAKTFSTVRDNQKILRVEVYQGENMRPQDNVHIGAIEVRVPSGRAGEQVIEVRFTYDINGALEVRVKVLSTGHQEQAIFQNNSGLSAAELQTRFEALDEIKLHPREQMENRSLIARAERLYAENTGMRRDEILVGLRQFSAAILDDHARDLTSVREGFARFLDAYEPFRFQS